MSTVYITSFEEALKLAKELVARGEIRRYYVDRDHGLTIEVLTDDDYWRPFWTDEIEFENYIPN